MGSVRLLSGLQVIAIPFPGAETVTIMFWYKAGSADDPPDKPGVAHFVEHATFAAMGDHNEDERRTTRGARDHEPGEPEAFTRSEEHTSELQSLMRISYAVFCLKKKRNINTKQHKLL